MGKPRNTRKYPTHAEIPEIPGNTRKKKTGHWSQYSSVNRSMYMIINKELEHSVCSKWNLGLFLKRIKSNFAGFLLWILSTFSNFKIILESPLRKTRECDPSDQGAGEGVWKKYKSNFHKNRNKRKMSWGKKAKVNLTLSERESNRFA